MRREGSPWQGLGTVVLKELADHMSSARMLVLELLIILTAGASVYTAIANLKETTAEDPFLLLKLFTVDRAPLPSFVAILGFLIPLMAIGLGFDAINGEHNRRTMSRILAQPIYRDALLAGKFLAGLATLAINLLCLWLLVVGFGVLLLGVPPGGEEIARSLTFLAMTLAYAGVWLAMAMLLSIVFRSPATAALVALGIWLFLTVLWPMLSPAVAELIAPPDIRSQLLGIPSLPTLEWRQALERLSPNTLYAEVVLAILSPSTRALGPVFLSQLQGAVVGAPLPLGESLMLAWPQAVGLIAGTIVLFVAGYVVFQRQEVRA
ncbi:MAG TPA: ABC transporter permease subunit [Dongiaceae bacterium]|nr:ABC transporter permease subunit [Dongiaceae bacterium]